MGHYHHDRAALHQGWFRLLSALSFPLRHEFDILHRACQATMSECGGAGPWGWICSESMHLVNWFVGTVLRFSNGAIVVSFCAVLFNWSSWVASYHFKGVVFVFLSSFIFLIRLAKGNEALKNMKAPHFHVVVSTFSHCQSLRWLLFETMTSVRQWLWLAWKRLCELGLMKDWKTHYI